MNKIFNSRTIQYTYILKDCYVCHLFGTLFDNAKFLLEENSNNKVKIMVDLSIISPMNKSCYENSYLANQCYINNIKLLKSKKLFNVNSSEWNNLLKIEGILELLEQVTTKYVLILDGKDTCMLKDLDDEFISKFKTYNADIVYNSMKTKYPPVKLETEEFLEVNNHKFINAGVCIGYRDKLISFYKECLTNIKHTVIGYDGKPSEQYVIRNTATKSNIIVRCDYNNILFNIPKIKRVDNK